MPNEITKTEKLPTLLTDLRQEIQKPTPTSEIKHRQGRGGMTVRYVTHGYIVNRLNELFGHLWDYNILEQQVGEGQVWVKGQLKVWLSPNFAITKTAYGGSEIKRTADGKIIDVGDDLKAGSADALKKCASLLGIANDVYSKVEDVVQKKVMTAEEIKVKVGM